MTLGYIRNVAQCQVYFDIHKFSLRQDLLVKWVPTHEVSAIPKIVAEYISLEQDLFFLWHDAIFFRWNFLYPSEQKTSVERFIIGIRE